MKVYVIHNPLRHDRRTHCENIIRPLFPTFEYFQAVVETPGQVGLLNTLYQLLSAVDKYENVLILEDDADFTSELPSIIENVVIPPDASLLYFGYNLWKKVKGSREEDFIKVPVDSVVALQCVIYTPKGIANALYWIHKELEQKNPAPVDVVYDKKIPDRYIYKKMIVGQIPSYSDIEKRMVSYNSYLENKAKENLCIL